MTRKEMLADLDYVRTLAEEGLHAPLLGSAHMVTFGLLTAGALAGHYWIVTVLDRAPLVGLMWLGFGVLFGVAGFVLDRRSAGRPGATAVSNRVEQAVWGGAGAAMFVIAIAAIGRMILESDELAPNVIPGSAFALYGAAQLTVAAMAKEPILRLSGWLAIGIAAIALTMANAPWMYLLTAGGVLLVHVIPGALLLAREPKETV